MSIVVVGSSNTDMVVTVPAIPGEGETVLGSNFTTYRGGKGANQAVAAARAGAEVTFIACIGQDGFGDEALDSFAQYQIDTGHVIRYPGRSGVALIMVDANGNNCIAVSPESNAALLPEHIVLNKEVIQQASVVLAQLETPLETIVTLSTWVSATTTFIVNPAPAQALDAALLARVDVITPNKTEAEILTGIAVVDLDSAHQAAVVLRQQGVTTVIITLGEQGALVDDDSYSGLVSGHVVQAVDTTGAGDVFNGALAQALVLNLPIVEAVEFANAAAALSVLEPGAQASAPSLSEIEKLLR